MIYIPPMFSMISQPLIEISSQFKMEINPDMFGQNWKICLGKIGKQQMTPWTQNDCAQTINHSLPPKFIISAVCARH